MCTAVSVSGVVSSSSLIPNTCAKVLQVLHPRVFERVRRLLTERRAIDQEQHPLEPLRLEQPIDERHTGLGLAGAGRHREQHFPPPFLDASLDRLDRLALIGPDREPVLERLRPSAAGWPLLRRASAA